MAFFKFSPATFYTSPYCPYAQRVSISLLECGLINSIQPKEYPSGIKIVEIDLKNKPDWYIRDVNPSGKVPAFQITLPDRQTPVLVESDLIVQFILNTQGSSLLTTTLSDPYQHYQGALFLTRFQPYVTGFYALLRAKQPDQQKEAMDQFLTTVRDLSKKDLATHGPFSLGPSPLWTDVLTASFLMRLPILKHYRALDIPTTSDYQRFHAWVDACSQLPSVKHSTSDMNMLIQFYAAMAN